MRRFEIAVDIPAAPERVWAVMSDVERWPEWTSSVRDARVLGGGPLLVGSRVRVRQPRLLPATWLVVELVEGRRFTWITTSPGLRAIAEHGIEPAAGGSRATLAVRFDGVLAPLVARWTRELNRRYLELEAEGLRRRSVSDRSP